MDEYKSEQIEELRSELYYKLKEEYIKLREEHELISKRLFKAHERIRKMTAVLYPLRLGRKYFNFCIKLAKERITEHAIKYDYDLGETCELIGKIDKLKKPPVNNYNKEQAEIFNEEVEEYDQIEQTKTPAI